MDCQNTVTNVTDKKTIKIRPPTLCLFVRLCLAKNMTTERVGRVCSLQRTADKKENIIWRDLYGHMQRRAVKRTQVCVYECVLV